MIAIRALGVLLLLGLVLSPAPVSAGGDSYLVKIVELMPSGNDEYRMILKLEEQRSINGAKQIVLYLRHHPQVLGRRPPAFVSKANYLSCIRVLKKQFTKGGRFRIGFLGTGLVPIKGKRDEYQSNALAELEEHTGRKVVYSLARPV